MLGRERENITLYVALQAITLWNKGGPEIMRQWKGAPGLMQVVLEANTKECLRQIR